MNIENIAFTTEFNLCSGCGICVGTCPKQCIQWKKKDNGIYQPLVNSNGCIKCGLCKEVCPGLGYQYGEKLELEAVQGDVLQSYNAWSRSPEIRHVSASGGIVSTIVQHLLEKENYDVAFLVDGYDYHHQLFTTAVTVKDLKEGIAFSSYPKSRYLPVSHEHAVFYARSNRTKKIIIVGTSCAIRGFLSVVEKLGLKRENYLLIGLFCDRVFTYNVIEYYSQSDFCGEKKLEELHFKNKESGGWPGNMKFIFSDGSIAYHDKSERAKVKDYFMPERCLYCIDKLNVCADISIGDNYTQQDSSLRGSNSIIIRTKRGMAAWQESESFVESHNVSVQEIMKAQFINWRLNNLCYGKLKEKEILNQSGQKIDLNQGVQTEKKQKEYYERWKENLKMLHIGEQYRGNPEALQKHIEKMDRKKKRGKVGQFGSRVYHFVKRRLVKKELP